MNSAAGPSGTYWYSSPLCWWRVCLEAGDVREVRAHATRCGAGPVLPECLLRRELDRYFSGRPVSFKSGIAPPSASGFTLDVWDRIRSIHWGRTIAYSQLAEEMGDRNLARAVAGACGRNRIALLIPCHRVVSLRGLGGYSAEGGVRLKRKLLELELSR